MVPWGAVVLGTLTDGQPCQLLSNYFTSLGEILCKKKELKTHNYSIHPGTESCERVPPQLSLGPHLDTLQWMGTVESHLPAQW